MLIAKDIVKSYKSQHVLQGVSLTVEDGEFVSIMGESGSGKSTLLSILSGNMSADSGSVLLDGEDISAFDDKALAKLRREKLGFVYQSLNLIPTLSARDNILLPAYLAKKGSDYEKERLKKVHDTQYDILKKLNVDSDFSEDIEDTEENIVNLINTITALELKNKESVGNTTALDLLSDLKDNSTDSVYKTMELDKEKSTENLDEEDLSIENKYDDFKELERDLNSNNIAIKVVGIIFLIIVLVLLFIFVNNYFKLGLF